MTIAIVCMLAQGVSGLVQFDTDGSGYQIQQGSFVYHLETQTQDQSDTLGVLCKTHGYAHVTGEVYVVGGQRHMIVATITQYWP